MAALYDLVVMTVSSAPGTGASIPLGNAATVNGVTYLTFASAGTPTTTSVAYSILDTGASEAGTATYLSSGPLLGTRTPTKSTNGNVAINASSAAIVLCGPRAEDIISTDLVQAFTDAQTLQARSNIGVYVSYDVASTDLNTLVTGGMFFIEASCTNQPVAATQYYLFVQKYPLSANYVQQTAWDITPSGGAWTRGQLAGSWSAWVPLLNAGAQTLTAAQRTQVRTNISAVLKGHLFGLTLSAAGATNVFGIAAGEAADSTGVDLMVLGSVYTKTNAAWAVGSGNGALDTGAAANSWYHVFLIKRPDTGVVDVLISLSATAPTLPANYTLFRRIGSMLTAAGSWLKFSQLGDEFLWAASVLDANGVAVGTAPVTQALSTPLNVQVRALLRVLGFSSTGIVSFLFNSFDENSVAVGTNRTVTNSAASVSLPMTVSIRTNTSSQIRVVADTASSLFYITTYGWIDDRGRLY